MPKSAELRAKARASLSGKWNRAALHTLLFLVVAMPLGLVPILPIALAPFVGWILTVVISGALTYGLSNFFLTISRGDNPATEVLFSGFKRLLDTFLLYLLMAIFTILWTLLFIIPGIIAAFRYSQAYYILRDNPEISALEAISRSKALMVGHKWRLFVLGLTFIGWYLLTCCTLGIGILWLTPYYYTAYAHFYNDLIARSASVPLPTPPSPYTEATI
jgi:uncharacterized membrane protein